MNKTLLCGSSTIYALGLLDLASTIIGLQLGYSELNPVAHLIGFPMFIALKLTLPSLLIYLLYTTTKNKWCYSVVLPVSLVLFSILQSLPVFNNLILITGA